MEKTMKKAFLMMLCLTFFSLTACEKADVPIEKSQLPKTAQQFIDQHFAKLDISYAMQDNDNLDVSYEVVFVNGYKLEFDKKGNWKEVNCKTDAIPTAIIPAKIKNYVTQNFGKQFIVKIDKSRAEIEVVLNNNLELIFDKNENFKRIDD